MAISDTVRTHHPHANFLTRLSNDIEASLNRIGALMVINDSCRPTHQCVNGTQFRRPINHVEVKRSIQAPPHLLQYF